VCCSDFFLFFVARGYEEGKRKYILMRGGALQYVAVCVAVFFPLVILLVARGHEEGERKYIVMGRGVSQYVAVCCNELQF